MNITPKGYTLELSYNELWTIAWSVRRDLEDSLKEHYIHYQDGAFERNEKEKLNILKEMYTYLGRIDLYEGIFKIKETVFKEFNNKSK